MRVIVCDNYEELSLKAAKMISGQVLLKPNSVLGLATGSTPLGLYKNLISMNINGDIDFSQVTTFNLDEYYPISSKNNQSYKYFMEENLFKHINIKPENTFIPNGETSNPSKECEEYEEKICEHCGVDLQILGIGQNGHIGFNEPDEYLSSLTHVTGLTKSTIEVNSRFFEDISHVPTKAITMGIATILKSKKIVLLASGKNKSSVVAELLSGDIKTQLPATMLNAHPDVVLICDKEARGNKNII